MMLFLHFVVLFSFAGSVTAEFTDWRARAPIRANDVLEVVVKSIGVEGFDEMLRTEHEAMDYWMSLDTVSEGISEVRDLLDFMAVRFMLTSQSYVVQHLYAYCGIAYGLLHRRAVSGYSMDEVREMIGFPDEHEYCMHTAFHDSGEAMLDVELLLESTLFFQTVGRDSELTIYDLKYQLKRFHQRVGVHHTNFHVDRLESSEEIGKISVDKLLSRMNELKRIITDFSNIFCTRWTSLVSNRFITGPESNDVIRLENVFVRHVFHWEKCMITFQWHGSRISSWNCGGILKSQEYRYQEFEENVMAPFEIKRKAINKKDTCESPLPKSTFLLLNDVPEEYRREVKYSLATLKQDLQWNSYYLNVVKYYNIASDVMLFASIKEGNKIFKWIKFVVSNNCINESEKPADEMRGLRSTLYAFKAIFDKIVLIIVDKKRINITRNRQKKTFDQQVNALTTLLDVQDNQMTTNQMQRICAVIQNKILNGENYDVHLDPNKAKFEEYYGTEPIIHISQLYHYIANDF